MPHISRGFTGRAASTSPHRLPPGQHDAGADFPVLTTGPVPRLGTEGWDFTVQGQVDDVRRWTWDQFRQLPRESITVDIHCVTSWSKFDTHWQGVSIDTILDGVDTAGEYALAFSDGGYTTNLPLEDLVDGKAWIVDTYDGEPLSPEHGGPARLLVPHLYFWKSAKWIRGLVLNVVDEPGFWENFGYHNYGDPWQEQRYAGD